MLRKRERRKEGAFGVWKEGSENGQYFFLIGLDARWGRGTQVCAYSALGCTFAPGFETRSGLHYKPEEGGKSRIAVVLGLDIFQKSSLVLFKRPSLSRLWAQQDIPDTLRV